MIEWLYALVMFLVPVSGALAIIAAFAYTIYFCWRSISEFRQRHSGR